MQLSIADILIVGFYLTIVLFMGFYLQKKASSGVTQYFLSGRNLSWWLAGTSMAASAFSVDTPLYVTDITRSGGIGANWEWWCYAIGGAFSVFFLARLWRRAGVITDVELSELRYSGKGAVILRAFRALVFSVFVNCLAMALVIKAMVSILADSMGLDPLLLIPICITVTAVYSILSGFWGVVVTDFLQFFLALSGALLLAVFSVSAVGGISEMTTQLGADSAVSPMNFLPRPGGDFWSSLPAMLALLFGIQWWAFINSDGGGKVIQRQMACRDEREAARATLWFLLTHYVIRTWPWLLTALASLILIPDLPAGHSAYVEVMLKVLPTGWRGFMLATFLAAFMSTIDTQLNWGSSYFVNDFYARFLRPAASEKHLILVSRLSGVFFLILAGIFTFYADSVTSVFRFILSMGAGIGPIYLLRWFWWRINAWSEISAMTLSMTVSSICRLYGLELAPSLIITLAASLPLALLVTMLTKPTEREHLKRFVARTRPFGFWADLRRPQDAPDAWLPLLTGCICLCLCIFGLLFGIGWLFFGFYGIGIPVTAAGLLCGFAVLKLLVPSSPERRDTCE